VDFAMLGNGLEDAFQAARPSCGAIAYIAHDGEPGGSEREHDAVATVLIIGASRGIGLETVKAALEAGHSVRAMARSARRIPIDHPKLEKIAESLGVSAGPEIIFGPTRIFSKATRVLVTAMEEAHVSRLICVTGFGAGDSRGHGGFRRVRPSKRILGDKAYDSAELREDLQERGTKPVIPNRCNRKQPFSFSKRIYKLRWRIESAFNRLKDFRRIATRYDRLARNYLASVCLVAALVWWI
jgi:transposase